MPKRKQRRARQNSHQKQDLTNCMTMPMQSIPASTSVTESRSTSKEFQLIERAFLLTKHELSRLENLDLPTPTIHEFDLQNTGETILLPVFTDVQQREYQRDDLAFGLEGVLSDIYHSAKGKRKCGDQAKIAFASSTRSDWSVVAESSTKGIDDVFQQRESLRAYRDIAELSLLRANTIHNNVNMRLNANQRSLRLSSTTPGSEKYTSLVRDTVEMLINFPRSLMEVKRTQDLKKAFDHQIDGLSSRLNPDVSKAESLTSKKRSTWVEGEYHRHSPTGKIYLCLTQQWGQNGRFLARMEDDDLVNDLVSGAVQPSELSKVNYDTNETYMDSTNWSGQIEAVSRHVKWLVPKFQNSMPKNGRHKALNQKQTSDENFVNMSMVYDASDYLLGQMRDITQDLEREEQAHMDDKSHDLLNSRDENLGMRIKLCDLSRNSVSGYVNSERLVQQLLDDKRDLVRRRVEVARELERVRSSLLEAGISGEAEMREGDHLNPQVKIQAVKMSKSNPSNEMMDQLSAVSLTKRSGRHSSKKFAKDRRRIARSMDSDLNLHSNAYSPTSNKFSYISEAHRIPETRAIRPLDSTYCSYNNGPDSRSTITNPSTGDQKPSLQRKLPSPPLISERTSFPPLSTSTSSPWSEWHILHPRSLVKLDSEMIPVKSQYELNLEEILKDRKLG